jgi:hypothetical protein
MAENFLEELVAEWYAHQGYFLIRNRKVGKRARGGYECELDVVAFKPSRRHLIHIEPSTAAGSWADLEVSYQKKFQAGKKYIYDKKYFPEFEGLQIPDEVEQIALLLYGSTKNRTTLGGGKILQISSLLKDILRDLAQHDFSIKAVPEHLPLLRGFQLIANFQEVLFQSKAVKREKTGIDSLADSQLVEIHQLIAAAFVDIRTLCREGQTKQAEALADAFHNLPDALHWAGSFNWDSIRNDFECYQSQYLNKTPRPRAITEWLDEIQAGKLAAKEDQPA